MEIILHTCTGMKKRKHFNNYLPVVLYPKHVMSDALLNKNTSNSTFHSLQCSKLAYTPIHTYSFGQWFKKIMLNLIFCLPILLYVSVSVLIGYILVRRAVSLIKMWQNLKKWHKDNDKCSEIKVYESRKDAWDQQTYTTNISGLTFSKQQSILCYEGVYKICLPSS